MDYIQHKVNGERHAAAVEAHQGFLQRRVPGMTRTSETILDNPEIQEILRRNKPTATLRKKAKRRTGNRAQDRQLSEIGM